LTIFSFFSASSPSQISTFTTGKKSPNHEHFIFIYDFGMGKVGSKKGKKVFTIYLCDTWYYGV